MPLLHESIADIPEQRLVAHVLGDAHYRHTLLSIKGMLADGARVLQQVQLRPYLKRQDREVDILVLPRDRPDQAIAIEVKRFKAIVKADEKGFDSAHVGHPLRLQELMAKGVQQANEMRDIGFSQVYLWIFVAIDTRERNNGWYTYDGPDSSLRAQIDRAVTPHKMDSTIGLVQFEWVQPMDRPPFEMSTHGGHLRQLAISVEQPPELTAWLSDQSHPSVHTPGVATRATAR